MIAAGLILSLLLSQTQHAPQRMGTDPLPPEQEARAQTLGKQLRCPMCQGMSIADSPASTARAQLDTIRALVTEGKTDQEIRDYFVARYGDWALLAPPAQGFNWVVWLAPGLVLLIGAAVIATLFKRNRAAPPAAAESGAATPATDTEDPYLKAVRAELER